MDNEELFEVVLDAIRDLADIHPDERVHFQRGAIFVDDDEFTGHHPDVLTAIRLILEGDEHIDVAGRTVPVECETITRIEVVQNE